MRRRLLALLGFTFVGFVAAVAVLFGAEIVLRVTGIGQDLPVRDPFAGFSRTVPLFVHVTNVSPPIYGLSWGRSVAAVGHTLDEPQRSFLAEKPEGTFRIFILGDSSAAGVPYGTREAFSMWLAQRLAVDLPDQRFEVVNAAIPGYATRRLVAVTEEILDYAPDLIIVYVGHNEYAERRYYEHLLTMDPRLFKLREWLVGTHLWRVLSRLAPAAPAATSAGPQISVEGNREEQEMFAVLDTRAAGRGYATAREREYGQLMYRSNLVRIVRMARGAGIPLMLLTQSQNFSDWSPGASAHRPDLGAGDLARWQQLVDDGAARAGAGDCTGALDRYRAALAIDDQFAELHYRIATCERTLGQFDAAREDYRRASNLDQVPHGAPTTFNDIVREVAVAEGALLTDASAAIEAASAHQLVGDDLFCDWVHPNVRGHQVIAAAIEQTLQRSGLPRPANAWKAAFVDPDVGTLYAAQPDLIRAERLMYMGTCLLARRAGCARASIDAVIAADPENPNWKDVRASVEKRIASWQQP